MRTPSQKTCLALVAALTLLTATVATGYYVSILRDDGACMLHVPLLAIFALLYVWIALAFWTATLGFVRELVNIWRARARPAERGAPLGGGSRTAVVMPIHNEEPQQVFAGLAAMWESVQATGQAEHFDFFVLSDTTDPDIWLQEELAWARLVSELGENGRVYYRRRQRNVGHKSGNIAEFCREWGGRYTYMVVLDADSLMAGETLVRMVARMESDPRVGILQVPPTPIDGDTLFSRVQQFAASVYGPVFISGFTACSQGVGNYWGHNAIIRVTPFAECCQLPELPGAPPLGGKILSHDFVEAALMHRAGWKICTASDLGGSYEGCPGTLNAFSQRDYRWCQGNMQHLRLLFASGFRPASRVHFATGVMFYLTSSLWLLWMILGVIEQATRSGAHAGHTPSHVGLGLFVVTMGLLLVPKLWGYLVLLLQPHRMHAHGGILCGGLSVLLETAISVLIAPLLMASHVLFVAATLLGRRVRWTAQPRSEAGLDWRDALDQHGWQANAGLIAALAIALAAPGLFWWFVPVVAGPILAVPLAVLLASSKMGQASRIGGLFLISEEADPPPILQARSRRLLLFTGNSPADPFLRVLLDPAFHSLHLQILRAGRAGADDPSATRLKRIVAAGGLQNLGPEDKLALLSSERALQWLHEAAWARWPVGTLRRFSAELAAQP
jgi:membrane glycosyltransferase